MGRVLPEPVRHRASMQAVLIAGAVANCWLAIGHPHDQALAAVDGMLALNNGCDRALKHFGATDACSHPEALGYTGAVGPLGENGRKLRELNLCCEVGKQHYWGNYMYSPSIVAQDPAVCGAGGSVERREKAEGSITKRIRGKMPECDCRSLIADCRLQITDDRHASPPTVFCLLPSAFPPCPSQSLIFAASGFQHHKPRCRFMMPVLCSAPPLPSNCALFVASYFGFPSI